jgi:hypothetical protein
MPGDAARDLLGGGIAIGRGSKQRGRCRTGCTTGPGTRDGRTGCHSLETPSLPAPAHCSGFVDDHMPDLAGHPMCSTYEFTLHYEPGTDSGSNADQGQRMWGDPFEAKALVCSHGGGVDVVLDDNGAPQRLAQLLAEIDGGGTNAEVHSHAHLTGRWIDLSRDPDSDRLEVVDPEGSHRGQGRCHHLATSVDYALDLVVAQNLAGLVDDDGGG